ncbi:MAG: cation:proton antiporter [Candidatus Eremiobacteraeota bacterium]|nr:cation:proton antiporter [Candidatus Eremiobacteraeota bacterium]
MRSVLIIILATSLTLVAHRLRGAGANLVGQEVAMALGFILIVSYLIGRVFPRAKLPMITGYMLTGVLFGPSLFRLVAPEWSAVSREALEDLSLLNHIALGLIAFTAGGELKISAIRQRWKTFFSITLIQSTSAFVGVGGLLFVLAPKLPGLSELSGPALAVTIVLLSCTAVAKSPATTIAVINESRSAGPMSDVALGVTVIKDMVVIGLFAASLSVSRAMMTPGEGPGLELALTLAWEVLGSILIGVVLGKTLSIIIEKLGEDLPLALLAIAFLAVYLAEHVHLHGLIICMTSGFVVENFSPHGEDFIHAVERYSLPVYVVFFTLAGADMKLQALGEVGGVASLLVVARAVFTYLGTWLGARLVKETQAIQNYGGLAFLGQAGVTLGFSVIISQSFPGVGETLSTIIVAAVAINQIVGPVAFRYALGKAGEIGMRKED